MESQALAGRMDEVSPEVLSAVRQHRGRVTLGDVMSGAGVERDRAEHTLRGLLSLYRGHVEVSETGEIVYLFDPAMMQRTQVPLLQRLKSLAWKVFVQAFKVWIMLMLVLYFVLFVALAIAAIVGTQGKGGQGRSHRRGGFRMPSWFVWYFLWSPDWRRRPYYGRHAVDRHGWDAGKVPFYKKVFAFVFGPDEPRPTQHQRDRSVLRLIRARKGVLSTAELMQHTGAPRPEAEEEMGRLMGSYGGEAHVTREGQLTFTFPELMLSASGAVSVHEPDPAWRRLQPDREVTGNKTSANWVIGGMNGFNLLAGITAPLFIFPRLGFSGLAAEVVLIYVPVAFSFVFFAVPLLRSLGIKRENADRKRGNLRRIVMGVVYNTVLRRSGSVSARGAAEGVRTALGDESMTEDDVRESLHELAAEFDADVKVDDEGLTSFSFPALRAEFVATERARRDLGLEKREIGEVVYSSADDEVQASEREAAAFDRELAGYVTAPSKVAYLDEYALIEFDEELAARRSMN